MRAPLLAVSNGFRMVNFGLLFLALTFVVRFLGGVAMAIRVVGIPSPRERLVFSVAELAFVSLGRFLGLVGKCRCPAAGVSEPTIAFSACCDVAAIGSAALVVLDDKHQVLPPELNALLALASNLFWVVGAVVFLTFARSLAVVIRRARLAARATSTIWLFVGAGVCYAATSVATLLIVGGRQGGGVAAGGCAAGLLGLATLVLGLLALIQYTSLLSGMTRALRTRAEQAGDDDEFEDDEFEDDRSDDGRPRRRDRDDDDDDRPRRRAQDEDDDRPRRDRERDDDRNQARRFDPDDDDDDRPRGRLR